MPFQSRVSEPITGLDSVPAPVLLRSSFHLGHTAFKLPGDSVLGPRHLTLVKMSRAARHVAGDVLATIVGWLLCILVDAVSVTAPCYPNLTFYPPVAYLFGGTKHAKFRLVVVRDHAGFVYVVLSGCSRERYVPCAC